MLTMDILGDLFQNIPVYHGGDEHKYFDCNNESVMLHISNTSKQEYDNYLLLLEEAGFKLFDSNTIRDNYFATYTPGSAVVFPKEINDI
jgi:hypothetical protein